MFIVEEEKYIPIRGRGEGDAGWDLKSRESKILAPGERGIFSTGVKLVLPEPHYFLLLSRSGLSIKYGVMVLNAPGLVDNSFRDEIRIVLYNSDKETFFKVEEGMRIAQGIVLPYLREIKTEVNPEMYSLLHERFPSERGKGGWGSSGEF